jgi:RNA-directed DNA polymerase
LAALDNGVRGGKWFSLMDKVWRMETLRVAWQRVRANRGAAGVDRQSVQAFAANAESHLQYLAGDLRSGRYRASAVRRVLIPKGSGKYRPLGIPVVKDRIVQTAVKMVIEPIFEARFAQCSYGFRPGRGAKDALRAVQCLLDAGYTHVVDADLQGYFDTSPQDRMRERVRELVSDGALLGLLDQWLTQEVMHGVERWTPSAGTPQGAVISPLLANWYLDGLDQALTAKGYRMVRYADDFVVLCASEHQAREALVEIRGWVRENGLQLHPEKTHVGDCRIAGQGFEFLGYRFESGKRRVRKKSWQAIRDRIRELTGRSRGVSLEQIVSELNPMLRGWFAYFQHAVAYTFKWLDQFVRRRLRALLRRQIRRRGGTGRALDDHIRWPNAFFAAHGLFTLVGARVAASQSR